MLKVTEQDNVAEIILNRPEVKNSFSIDLIKEITKTFQALAKKKDLRGVILSGQGTVFCSGADLNWMKSLVNYSYEDNLKDAEALHEMFAAMWNFPATILTIAHGAVYGGGLGLLACSDYVFMEEKTQLCFSEVKLGISPAVISPFILAKANLSAYMVTGKVFQAQIALNTGLAQETFTQDNFEKTYESMKLMLQQMAPEASARTKKLLRSVKELPTLQAKEITTKTIAELRVGTEGQEGLDAFLQKRKPRWSVE